MGCIAASLVSRPARRVGLAEKLVMLVLDCVAVSSVVWWQGERVVACVALTPSVANEDDGGGDVWLSLTSGAWLFLVLA